MTKRANGQGSVYKRGHYWTVQITIGYNEKGQPRYKRKGGFRTKTEALQAINDIRKAVLAKPIPTVSYYYHTFERGKGGNITRHKLAAYKRAYEKLKQIHTMPINEVTVQQLQAIFSEAFDSYYPAHDARVLLNHIYRLAAADGNVNASIPGLIELPKLEETQRDAFTEEEQIALWLSYEAGNSLAAAPLIMIYTGMMPGELRLLTRSMIHLEDKEIVGAGLKTPTRRTNSVLIPDDIIPVLQDVIDRSDSDLLFPGHEKRFYQNFYDSLKTAGITRHLTPYSCRHTTASALAVTANVAPQTVQRIMRWSSTQMMDRYVHPGERDARTAINRI